MSDQDSLFRDLLDGGEERVVSEPVVHGLSQWKIDMLRAALDRKGLSSMLERQRAVEAIVGHNVANLRQLTSGEATAVLEALSNVDRTRNASNWDDREEATWIDRL